MPAAVRSKRETDDGTAPVEHNLYVLVGGEGAPIDQKSRGLTLAVLKYVHDRLELFQGMGLRVRVHRVPGANLKKDARLVGAMKAKGITSLPALVTPNNTYVGNREIEGVYEENLREYAAWKRRGAESPAGMAPEDDLDSFYRKEMTLERAQEEEEDFSEKGGIGEGSDMMDSYRLMMQRREAQGAPRGESRDARARPRAPGSGGGAPRGPAPRPSALGRPDNLAGEDPESADSYDRLVAQMAGDIDAQTHEKAFAGGGGDSLDDGMDGGGGGGAQDDLMERAYWGNQELSM